MRLLSGLVRNESCIHWAALISATRVCVMTLSAESSTFTSGVLVGAGVSVGGLTMALTVAPTFISGSVLVASTEGGVGVTLLATGCPVGVGGVSTSVIDTILGVGVAADEATGVTVGLDPKSQPVATVPSNIHRATKARNLLKTRNSISIQV